MPIIDQSAVAARPFFPVDVSSAPAATQQQTTASTSGAAPETVTVTASKQPQDSNNKSFFDNLLDIVNPLEHLPIVSTIYSNLTGDKPQDMEQLAGDTIYGGPLGFASSLGNILFTKITGKSVGDTVWGWLTDHDGSSPKQVTASTSTATSPAKPDDDAPRGEFALLRAEIAAASQRSRKHPANAASASAAPAAAALPVITAPAPQVVSTPASEMATSTSASVPAAVASGEPRMLNPLPLRGAPPVMHKSGPSETRRAAGLASMVAKRANLKVPASESQPVASPSAAPPATQSNAQTASAAQPTPTIPVGADGIPTLDSAGEKALLNALNQNGVSAELGQRALMAYQKTMAMTPDPANAAALQSATLH